MSEQTTPPPKKIDWHDVKQKVVTAIMIGVVLGGGTLAWNSFSNERVLKLFGGVTRQDVEEMLRTSPNANPIKGAVVAFDGPCPSGWFSADEMTGATPVGAGATLVGAPGFPASPERVRSGANDLTIRPAGSPAPRIAPGSIITPRREADGQAISHYVFGVKTTLLPTYVPLFFCKKE